MQYLSETLENKWSPILDHKDLPDIKDIHRRQVVGQILENQQSYLSEATPASVSGDVATWDPILISLVRRALPNLIAFDVCGVQPMTGPTGLIFALKATYDNDPTGSAVSAGDEALGLDEPVTDFSSNGTEGDVAHSGTDPARTASNAYGGSAFANTARGMTTALGETDVDPTMGVTIAKVQVTAKTRFLKASYSTELAQDMKAVHGLDAETELSNILSAEILAEINREIIRSLNTVAIMGAAAATTAGTFDLDTDSNGRWSVEKFKGLMFQIEREANQIAKGTRRGKGNFIITSSDVASALSMAGILDHAPALQTNLNVDDSGNTLAGVLNGKTKVYVDPYISATSTEYVTVGYKGPSPFDAGFFYCPYVPLQLVRALDESSFQPKIAFKTRYGVAGTPYVNSGVPQVNTNPYYRTFIVSNLM